MHENKKVLSSVKKGFGFFEWLDRKAERAERKRNLEMRELQAKAKAEFEIMNLREDEWSQEKEWQIRQKWLKRYELGQ